MLTEVQKWGNSLAVRIPKHMAKDMNIYNGAQVEFSSNGKSLILTPSAQKEYKLDDLLNGITAENLHSETDIGKSVGNEIIEWVKPFVQMLDI